MPRPSTVARPRRARRSQQRRLKGHVDDVGHHAIPGEHVQIHLQGPGAVHPERRGVHQQGCAARTIVALAPVERLHARAEGRGQGTGTLAGAAEEADLAGTGLLEGVDDAASRAAGTEQRYDGAIEREAWHGCPDIAHKARAVGVVRYQPVALVPERVGGAGRARCGSVTSATAKAVSL